METTWRPCSRTVLPLLLLLAGACAPRSTLEPHGEPEGTTGLAADAAAVSADAETDEDAGELGDPARGDAGAAAADATQRTGGAGHGTSDAGIADVGIPDAGHGTTDAGHGMADGGLIDAGHGLTDAGHGTTDAGHGTTDAGHGTTDAGVAPDAAPQGGLDASASDASAPDASVPDASAPDASAPPPVPTGRPIRVMPLGDSITAGYPTADGYRLELWDRAQAAQLAIQYVGSETSGDASLPDPHHEGHPGWTIDQIDASVAGWLAAAQPDVILLMIGSNDVFQQLDLAGAPARLSTLIQHIGAALPTARLVVSSIPPQRTTDRLGNVAAFNAAIPGVVQALAQAGQLVTFTDNGGQLLLSDISSDNLHPLPSGYLELGDRWFTALSSVVPGP